MEYDKQKFTKVRDKKVLHKVKKQWVVMSMALLATLGAKALATHPVHADVNNNANNSQKTISSKPQSNTELVNSQSQSSHNQVPSSTETSASNDQIMHQAKVLKQGIMNHAITSVSSSSNASQLSTVKRQVAPTRSGLSTSASQSDEGSVGFQYKDQNGRAVGKPVIIHGRIGDRTDLSDLTNYNDELPIPYGYHLRNYYTNNGKTPYYYAKQPKIEIIHIQGNNVTTKPIKVYLHIENSDEGSDVKTISDYVPKSSTLVGDVIAEPNQFLNESQYKGYFDNHPSDYHLDNNNGRDHDVLAQQDAAGDIIPKQIDFYYVHKSQTIPMGVARIKTYYYDRQNYDPSKDFKWNDAHSLVHDSVNNDLGPANTGFNYQSRQNNVPAGYYFVKNLNQAPVRFGSSKSTDYYNIEVAKNSRIVYQIPSDNYRVIDQSDVKGFNMNGEQDSIKPYVKPQAGFWTLGGPYTTQKGTQPVSTISNGQTYYVNLSQRVPVTVNYVDEDQPNHVVYSVTRNVKFGQPQIINNASVVQNKIPKWHVANAGDVAPTQTFTHPQTLTVPVYTDVTGQVIYHDVSDNQNFPISDNRGVVTGRPGMPINYQNYLKYLPSDYHVDSADQAKDADWKLISDNDYTINVDRNQGRVNVNYVNDNGKVLKTVISNGYVKAPFNINSYVNGNYINQLLPNYHFDQILNDKVQGYTIAPQNIYIKVGQNQPRFSDASIELEYVNAQNNVVEKYLTISGRKGTPIYYGPYTTTDYLPQGYTYAGLGAHANDFEDGAKSVILLNQIPNVQPAPRKASVELNYIDATTGALKNQVNISGVSGTSVDYSQYTSGSYIPQGYTYDGLGDHVNTFGDGDASMILLRKNQPILPNQSKSQPNAQIQLANVTLDYVDQSDGSIKRQINLTGAAGSPIDYGQYITVNNIPQGYTYAGLGNHNAVFQDGSINDVLLNKISPVSRRNTKPIVHHSTKKSSIDVVYEDPQGHIIHKHVYKGAPGETFSANKYKALPGYRFKKVVLGSRTDKFGNRKQVVVMQMLPVSENRVGHKASAGISHNEPLSSGISENANESNASMREAAAYGINNQPLIDGNGDPSVNDNQLSNVNGISSGNTNNKLPQTGEQQDNNIKILGLMLLMISAALIAGYDFDVKRRY